MANVEKLAADSIWYGGRVYTVDSVFSTATAIACRNGRILYVGDDRTAAEFAGPQTRQFALNSATVVPGLIDSHLHLPMYGQSLLWLPIRDRSREEILCMVEQAVQNLQPGEWLLGGMGWNNEVWADQAYPTCEMIDRVAPNNPVLLPRMDGHLIWVNSRAFNAAGISQDSVNPPGGEYMRTPDGRLLGCVGNAACDAIRAVIPPARQEARLQALLTAQEKLLAYGVTSVLDAASDVDTLKDLQLLYATGRYQLRFAGALRDALGRHADPQAQAYYRSCPHVNLFDHHFTVRAIKLIADGSVGAQSAALMEPYTDRPDHQGVLMYSDAELDEVLRQALQDGMQVITHAIGDAAIEQALSAYERALTRYPSPDHRFRLEHFQLVRGDTRERSLKLGVLASMQPTHAPNSASMALRRLGPERAQRAYALGMVMRVLRRVAGGSDAPVASPDPLDGIHSAVTRRNAQGKPEEGFFMENAVTREQALRMYTEWGAFAQFAEMDRGTLEAGKLADFVVLNQDLMAVEENELTGIRVLSTVIGGVEVYRNDQSGDIERRTRLL